MTIRIFLRLQAAALVSLALWAAPAWAQTPVIIEATIAKDGSVSDVRQITRIPAELVQPPVILAAPADPKVMVVPPGYAIVDVTIGTDGAVRSVALVKGDATLTAPALEVIRKWHYKPTLLNGAPIEVKMTVLVPIKSPGR